MQATMTKAKLIDTMQDAHARWQALLTEVGEDRMTIPGVEGDWTVKDIVAHVTYYESAVLRYLQAAQRHEPPARNPATAGMDMDQRNHWIYEQNRHRPLHEILQESRTTYANLLQTVQALPEQDLFDPTRFPWTGGSPLWEAIPGDNYDHYADHEANIRAWLRTS